MIQRSKQRYSNMLWNMRSITRHKRSYGHPLHPDLTPDVLTCVLPLGTVSSGRESEVESAHFFLTVIQFFSACHLTSHHIDDEVTARTAKASIAFGRLRTNVWERNGIRLETKLKVYKAVVLPTLLYACETWTVYQRHAKKLNHFHLSCLRKLLKIRWQDKIPDTEVLKKAKMQSIHTLLKLAQLRWTGHVTRMTDERLPKKVLYGELQEGKRSQGGQKKNATKTPLKPRLRISIFQLSPGNRLLRIEQSGVASSTKVPPNLKKRESVKLKGSVKKGKQEPKNHHQSQRSPNSHALFCNRQFNTQTHINA